MRHTEIVGGQQTASEDQESSKSSSNNSPEELERKRNLLIRHNLEHISKLRFFLLWDVDVYMALNGGAGIPYAQGWCFPDLN